MSTPSFNGLPHGVPAIRSLIKRDQWVCFKLVPGKDGGSKKPPVDPITGRLAEGSVSTWGASYKAALARAQKDSLPGVGIVLRGGEGLVGIDLDHCIDPGTGTLSPMAAEIIAFGETYAERSPSGTGIRLFAQGCLEQAISRSDLGIEAYGDGRYLTVTGRHINGTPYDIRPAPKTLAALRRLAGVDQGTNQGGQEGGEEQSEPPLSQQPNKPSAEPWFAINRAALDHLDAWVLELFPQARRSSKGYRVSSRDLSRHLQEDLSITRKGITDWGLDDLGPKGKGNSRHSPIDLVIQREAAPNAAEAARWLCDRIGIDPASLGWKDQTKPGSTTAHPTYPDCTKPVEKVREEIRVAIGKHLVLCQG